MFYQLSSLVLRIFVLFFCFSVQLLFSCHNRGWSKEDHYLRLQKVSKFVFLLPEFVQASPFSFKSALLFARNVC